MVYTRFKQPYDTATLATLRPEDTQSVANVATVATSQGQKKSFGRESVASVATLSGAGREPYSGPYADAVGALEHSNATDNPERWEMAKRDARAFLNQWGEDAFRLGWSSLDLFGLHPTHPFVRYDAMGLAWLLCGLTVVEIEEHRAWLSNGQSYYRRFWPARTQGAIIN